MFSADLFLKSKKGGKSGVWFLHLVNFLFSSSKLEILIINIVFITPFEFYKIFLELFSY